MKRINETLTNLLKLFIVSVVYRGLPQTPVMESFEATVNGYKLSTITAKLLILNVSGIPGYTS